MADTYRLVLDRQRGHKWHIARDGSGPALCGRGGDWVVRGEVITRRYVRDALRRGRFNQTLCSRCRNRAERDHLFGDVT